ncbi:MAG: L-carnitine dehydratase/bile acid-inducible protein F, partial [uncultured Thermomicrobiales bacterium]
GGRSGKRNSRRRGAAGRDPGGGSDPGDDRPLRHDDARRFGRRRGQDRAAGQGRRHPVLGAAVRRRRIGLLPLHQPQQALGRARSQARGRAGRALAPAGRRRRGGRELFAGHRRPARVRTRGGPGALPADRLRLDLRLRSNRPGGQPHRLRPDPPGNGRDDEHHRPTRRPADQARGADRRHRGRDVRRLRDPGRALRPRADGRGAIPRHLDARRPGGAADLPGRDPLRHRPDTGAAGQRPPDRRPLRHLPDRRRLRQPGGWQRRALATLLRRLRPARRRGRSPLRHQRRPDHPPRAAERDCQRGLVRPPDRRGGRPPGRLLRPLRPDPRRRRGLRRPPNAGPGPGPRNPAPDARHGESDGIPVPVPRHAAGDPPAAAAAGAAHRRGVGGGRVRGGRDRGVGGGGGDPDPAPI